MAIQKPTDLSNWLLKLNFTIFTWKLNIGDWIEVAIDWAISWVNWVYSWAKAAYDWGQWLWDELKQRAKELGSKIDREIAKVLSRIEVWWGDLGEWWSTKVTLIEGWIAASAATFQLLFNDLSTTFQRLSIAWDNFRTTTLPQLLTFSWWFSFWGGRFSSIWDWWRPEKQKVSDEIETNVKPVRDEVNKHTSWLDMIKTLFTDPEKFVEELLAKIW